MPDTVLDNVSYNAYLDEWRRAGRQGTLEEFAKARGWEPTRRKIPMATMPWKPEHWSEQYGVPKWAATAGGIGAGVATAASLGLPFVPKGALASTLIPYGNLGWLGRGAAASPGLAKTVSLGAGMWGGGTTAGALSSPPPTRDKDLIRQLGLGGETPPTKPPSLPSDGFDQPEFPTKPPPPGYRWEWDSATMSYVLEPDPTAAGMTPYQREQVRLAQEEANRTGQISPLDQAKLDAAQANELWNRQWLQSQAQQKVQQEQEQQNLQYQQWQQQFQWEQQQAQAQQAEKERQYRSQLAANPRSWLEYASYTGETPMIQPWMLPLMSNQYSNLQAGQPVPGFQAGATSMRGMPGLVNPSMQYLARMGPTSQQQWLGYNQAQSGINPEEAQFRVRSMAPPGGGGNTWLNWGR